MTRTAPATPPRPTPSAFASGSGFAVAPQHDAPPRSRDPERRVGARMIALGLAMRAKLGTPDDRALGLAVVSSADALEPDDPVRVEVKAIAQDWRRISLDGPELARAGERLFQAVMRSSWPGPAARADLEG